MTGESPRDASLLLRLELVFMWMPLKLNQLLSRESGTHAPSPGKTVYQ